MDPLCFFAKSPDQVIVDRLGDQVAAFPDSMAFPTRCRPCRSKDEIAVGILHEAFRVVGPDLSAGILISRHDRHDRIQ
jgi:hypothetical protein